jgi:hypothetical protein
MFPKYSLFVFCTQFYVSNTRMLGFLLAFSAGQVPVQWVPAALSLGIKRPGREADHSPSSSAKVKE